MSSRRDKRGTPGSRRVHEGLEGQTWVRGRGTRGQEVVKKGLG